MARRTFYKTTDSFLHDSLRHVTPCTHYVILYPQNGDSIETIDCDAISSHVYIDEIHLV